MIDLIRKYYEIDKDVRKKFDLIYAYHVLITKLDVNYEIKFKFINDLESLMKIIQKCMFSTDYCIEYIVDNILEIVDCRDITIEEMENLSVDELLEIVFYDNKIQEDDDLEDINEKENETKYKQGVLTEFSCGNHYCILCKHKEKYMVILISGKDVKGVILDNVEEVYDGTLENKLKELYLHD